MEAILSDYDQRAFDRLFDKTIVANNGCFEFTGATNPRGYGSFKYGRGNINAHRAAYLLCVADIPDGMLVRHTCDNRICINPQHLILGTSQDNSDDMKNKERQDRGENRYNAKLTDNDIKAIRKLRDEGITPAEIARHFNISPPNASMISRRLRWMHVKD